MPDQPQRRSLTFRDFDEVLVDVENLRARGYVKAGHWDLAQVCGHLADWTSYSVNGFPRTGCVIGTLLWLIKVTVGPAKRRKMLATGVMPSGKPTLPQTVPPAGADEAAAVAKLKAAVERFRAHPGEYRPSPIFGRMSRDEWTRLVLLHCAHHLSYLIPKANEAGRRTPETT
jgi:hypothetical protein